MRTSKRNPGAGIMGRMRQRHSASCPTQNPHRQ